MNGLQVKQQKRTLEQLFSSLSQMAKSHCCNKTWWFFACTSLRFGFRFSLKAAHLENLVEIHCHQLFILCEADTLICPLWSIFQHFCVGGTWNWVKCKMASVSTLLLVDQPQLCFQSSWERSWETAGICMQHSRQGVLIGLIVFTAALQKTTNEKPPCNKLIG